jgi:histone H3
MANTTPKAEFSPELVTNNISRPALKRILHRAAVKRASDNTYEELRRLLSEFLEAMVKDVVTYTKHNNRKTIQVEDVEAALDARGINLGAGISKTGESRTLHACTSRGRHATGHNAKAAEPKKVESKKASSKKEVVEAPAPQQVKKPHRFRPGTAATRSIRRIQANSDCLNIPKANFERLVRAIVGKYFEDARIAAHVFDIVQLATEKYLERISYNANLISIHAKRVTLDASDITLAHDLSKSVFL